MICIKTVKKYCKNYTEIENYDEALKSEKPYVVHHRLELIETGGVVDASKQDLIDWGIYYNRPADELIFMEKSEHRKLHMYGNTISKSNEAWNKGLHLSEETKKKASETVKAKNLHWYTNGIENVKAFECPEGFKPGRLTPWQ